MDVIHQMAVAGAVLAGFSAMLWLLRRRGMLRVRGWAALAPSRRRAARSLESLERLPLTPQHTLHLVRLGERALLLAATPGGCTLVESVDCRDVSGLRAREQA